MSLPLRGVYRTDLLARALYAEGAGIARAIPEAIAVPADADDAASLVRWATERNVALIPRGSGSGMAGGAVGSDVIVDMSRLDAIGEIDVARRSVWVGPGALRGAVDAAARAHGLRFPVDPSSGAFCTIGGMTATNAAGARTLKYGATRRWIGAVECVLASGERVIIRRGSAPPEALPIDRFMSDVARVITTADASHLSHAGVRKESSGYGIAEFRESGDLVDIIAGSEGTICLITALELVLDPVPPATGSVLAAFGSIDDAVHAASASREIGASAVEMLDRTFLDVAAVGGSHPLPPDTESALLIEVESDSVDDVAHRSREIADAARSSHASVVQVALDASAERQLWELRHAASPILSRMDPHLKSMQFIEDAAVPPDRLPIYVTGVRAALAARGIRGVIFGHAGDAHVHVNPLVDVRKPRWREDIADLFEEVTSLVASLGGTVAGEHGDGRLRAPVLSRVWPESAMDLFTRTKNAFDPNGTFNRGAKICLAGQNPFDEVKYDPALAPLPEAARAALDGIERERGYARFRLALG